MAANFTNSTPINNETTYDIHDLALGLCFAGSVLSIFGAVVIFLSYYYVVGTRNFTRYLLVCLTTADLVTALGYLVGTVRYYIVEDQFGRVTTSKAEVVCVAQSFGTIFSNMASYFWTVLIAVHIYVTVVYQTTRTRRQHWRIFFHLISWCIPAIIATTALCFGVLGEDSSVRPLPWCFLRGDIGHTQFLVWTFLSSIVWEMTAYIITVTLYLYLKVYLFRRHRSKTLHEVHRSLRREDNMFTYVWLVLYLLKIWGTVRLFIIIVHPDKGGPVIDHVMSILLYIQSFATSGQAFWNAIFFCVCDKTVRTAFCRALCRRLGRERVRSEMEIEGDVTDDSVSNSQVSDDTTNERSPLINNSMTPVGRLRAT